MNIGSSFPAWAEGFDPNEPFHARPPVGSQHLDGVDKSEFAARGSVTPPVVVTCPDGQEPYVVEQKGRKASIGCADKAAASAVKAKGPVVTVECPEGTEADVIYGSKHEAIVGCFPAERK
jgi:hypothetical protein